MLKLLPGDNVGEGQPLYYTEHVFMEHKKMALAIVQGRGDNKNYSWCHL